MPYADKNKIAEYNKQYSKSHQKEYKNYYSKYCRSIKGKERNKRSYESHKETIFVRHHNNISDKKYFINAIKTLNGCCNSQCSFKSIHPCQLDFHHLETKLFTIGSSNCAVGWKKLICEIEKCTVLCSNCHRLVSYGVLNANNFLKCKINNEEVINE